MDGHLERQALGARQLERADAPVRIEQRDEAPAPPRVLAACRREESGSVSGILDLLDGILHAGVRCTESIRAGNDARGGVNRRAAAELHPAAVMRYRD